jgi:hypothetical protein
MGIQSKGLKAEVRNLNFKVDKEVKILSVLIHWGMVFKVLFCNACAGKSLVIIWTI